MSRIRLVSMLVAAAVVAFLPITAAAAPSDTGGRLAVPLAVTVDQQRQEITALQGQLQAVTAQRDQDQAQVSDLQGQVSSLQDQVASLQQTGGGGGGAPVATTHYAVGPVANHFYPGQCTWYVASRRPIPWFGNAGEWYAAAAAMGFAEGQTPRPGAVMVTWESAVGHVAYVESVSGSYWTVSEMNFIAPFVVDTRTLTYGKVPLAGFIYG